jgi:hypothetical protein
MNGDLERQVVEGDVVPPRRVTAKVYIRSKGLPIPDKADLMAFGATAARIAAARKLQGLKRREDGFMVHTWPVDVWDAALRGDEAPARPATQRQIAYLMLLTIDYYGMASGRSLLSELDNLMDEDEAGRRIQRMTGP